MKAYFDGPYPTFYLMPQPIRDGLWDRFMDTYKFSIESKYGTVRDIQLEFDPDSWIDAVNGPSKGRVYGFCSRQPASLVLVHLLYLDVQYLHMMKSWLCKYNQMLAPGFTPTVLGVKLLRKLDIPEEKYTFLGYGPEDSHFVIELTYNYGINKYDIENGFGHFGIAVEDIPLSLLRFAAAYVQIICKLNSSIKSIMLAVGI
ncbi:probable lactoylglutathione lyase, chloroplastic [Olea europaea subsp. europaea]|uniref:Probable lactoylglutathione lyase, chloroplastic n=1 Tax=Olea europaea subsp. europaea TaxID=158383 RepID=A0A8S0V033_OLEEU|nr:probable lactoylglutathione lyase, chloroplastic [Olea europaea subsp. europaea]